MENVPNLGDILPHLRQINKFILRIDENYLGEDGWLKIGVGM